MRDLRTELTVEEEKKPYAKYFHREIVNPNQELMEILKKGPMDASKALMPEDIKHLLDSEYDEVETG